MPNPKILLLDSNAEFRRTLTFLLTTTGYTVTSVADELEALHSILLCDEPSVAFDLLVVGHGLLGKEGAAFIQAFRTISDFPPILAIDHGSGVNFVFPEDCEGAVPEVTRCPPEDILQAITSLCTSPC